MVARSARDRMVARPVSIWPSGADGVGTVPAVATYLDRILRAHRERAAADARSLPALVRLAEEVAESSPARGFGASLRAASGLGRLAVIAEIKRRSPSKGPLRPDVDPEKLARAYQDGGAAALSVLTDREFFDGSPADLAAARAGTDLPVLRKDFTVAALDVCDARVMGADCVLLIVAALDQAELRDLHELAGHVGLDALVEVHDEPELERALDVGVTVVGVNQRDLVTFEVDQRRAVRIAPRIPDDVVRVAESGVRGTDDARALHAAGYHAVLVGEGLVTAADPVAAVRELTGGP
jgi:indole-3-glycerol phosphate synthase